MGEQTAENVHTRVTTVRLSEDLAEQVDLAARAEGVTFAEFIRTAVDAHLAALKADRDFRIRLAARIARDQAILEALR